MHDRAGRCRSDREGPVFAMGEGGTSRDALLGGRVTLLQPRQGFRVAVDSLLLAAASAPPTGAKVLDLGCGVGAAALCLLARRRDLQVTGLEIQEEMVRLACRNAEANGCAERFLPLLGDAASPPQEVRDRSFDWAISNPPYLAQGEGGASPLPGKTRANQESGLAIGGWIDALLRRLRPGGGLTLVYRADRLPELLAGLEGRAGGIAVLPLWPRQGQPARRVLVAARKGARAPALLLPGLVLHQADGRFTEEAEAVLRGGASLPLSTDGGQARP